MNSSVRFFLFKILLCLLYQISEHIIVQITFIIIFVVSLLSLSRNKTNSHFLNNWRLWGDITSQADRIWSEHLIWPWKATTWIRFIKREIGIFWNEKAMRATSEGENEANILMSSCFKKDRILISVSVFIITISLVAATAYYHCTCSVYFIHTMRFQLYVRFSKIFFFFFEQVNQEHIFKSSSYVATHYLYVYFYFWINRSLTFW